MDQGDAQFVLSLMLLVCLVVYVVIMCVILRHQRALQRRVGDLEHRLYSGHVAEQVMRDLNAAAIRALGKAADGGND